MFKTSLTPDQVLALLVASPTRIAALTVDLTPHQLHTRPGADGWSLNDLLSHLRSCADVWGGSIATMIGEDKPTIRAVNPRTWIKRTNYRELEFRPSLRSFRKQRADLVAVLEPLPPEGWLRSATVTGAGAVLQRTVLTYGQALAAHERQHLKQIQRIVNAVPR